MNHKFCHISPLDIHEYQMETQKDQIDKKMSTGSEATAFKYPIQMRVFPSIGNLNALLATF